LRREAPHADPWRVSLEQRRARAYSLFAAIIRVLAMPIPKRGARHPLSAPVRRIPSVQSRIASSRGGGQGCLPV